MARGILKTWRMPLIMQKAGTTKAYFPLVFLKSEAMCVKGKCLFLFSRVYVYMCVCVNRSHFTIVNRKNILIMEYISIQINGTD